MSTLTVSTGRGGHKPVSNPAKGILSAAGQFDSGRLRQGCLVGKELYQEAEAPDTHRLPPSSGNQNASLRIRLQHCHPGGPLLPSVCQCPVICIVASRSQKLEPPFHPSFLPRTSRSSFPARDERFEGSVISVDLAQCSQMDHAQLTLQWPKIERPGGLKWPGYYSWSDEFCTCGMCEH